MTTRDADYITYVRANTIALWTAYNNLFAAQNQWNALDYGNTLPDGSGANAGITKSQVGAVVFDTAAAIKTVMDAGNATNIANIL